ncbi:MAP7 domain-containing protein 2-like [Brachionichthys hirsutus]|uniref:MAP7 domain-containing protein 2-like n=1 Tax=Brachionichthys hirsutus TaxID=412623 RepID=UPI0036051353
MAQQSSSPGVRRRSDGSVRECLFFPVSERNEQERLEALVHRRTEGTSRRGRAAGDNRPKRWTWGGPPDGDVAVFLCPPMMYPPINKQLSNSSTSLHAPETASPNNHRPFRSSSNRRSIAGLPEDTPRTRTPHGDSPNAPVRSSSFRTSRKAPISPKWVTSNKSRAQSPCSSSQYPAPPLHQRVTTPDDRGHTEVKGHNTLERKTSKAEMSERKFHKSTSKELPAESPGNAVSRSVGGTTDAEEASRLLSERRRLARIQKEMEERQRQEEDRLRAEEEQRRHQEARERQERAAQQAEEERGRREEERRITEEEERRQKEQRWKDMQEQLDREREEAFMRAQKEAETKRQERELLHIQEEQERLQRKKRIEEIMKRTRRSDMEPLSDAAGDFTDFIRPQPTDMRTETAVPSEDDVPVIMLGPLEKRCVDELSDGVQSMDVSSPSVSISPVSRDEHASAQEFSPIMEGSDSCPLDHMMDVSIHLQGPGAETQAGNGVGDLNKNLLIEACDAASGSSQFIHSIGPSKLDVQ